MLFLNLYSLIPYTKEENFWKAMTYLISFLPFKAALKSPTKHHYESFILFNKKKQFTLSELPVSKLEVFNP